MKSFKSFITEIKQQKIGKRMGNDLYVHRDYVSQSEIPNDLHEKAFKILKQHYPDFNHTIVKYNKNTNNISFLTTSDWDSASEPLVDHSIQVKADGAISKPRIVNQIYHKKHEFVGPDYTGFDIEKSKQREKAYTKTIQKLADSNGVSSRYYSSRIGSPDFWNKEVVPHIKPESS